MARSKKCTEKDISMLLETDSDNDIEESTECYTPSKHMNENSSDTSESSQIFDNNNRLLLRKNVLQKEQVSLRLRLRRSTEQSSYKIDSDSDNEKTKRSTRIAKHQLKRLQDENQMPRKGARIIRLPKKYSDYECSSPNSQTLVLRKKQIDCKRKGSFSTAFIDDKKKNEKYDIKYNDHKDNNSDSDCICVSFVPNTRSTRSKTMSENNKLYQVTSIGSNDDNALPRIRTRSSKPTSKNVESKRDNINKVLLDDKISINSKTIEHTSSPRTLKKRLKTEYDSLDTTPKKRLAKIEYTSLNNTPKRQIKNDNIRRCLSTSKYNPAIHETKDKEKIDEIAVICENTKDISIKVKQRDKNTKNVTESIIVQNTPSTPKSRTSLKHNVLTPSMKMRTRIPNKPTTPLQKARLRLHVSAVPKSLPCREEEFNDIYAFLEGKLIDNRGGCIYVSGVPGTGKTATVNEVVKCLKHSVKMHKLDQFDFVEINGMKLSEPRQAYVQILKQLSGKVVTWEQAYNALEKRFNSSVKKSMTLLLVDELDLLCTKRQDVIYNILDWPTKAFAQLVVITIANTMDLPERVLMGRVTSRLGLTRVIFQPYNHEQLQEIVITRLKDTDIFKSEAIQLIARKVSAVSGDARRALDICRRAAEITEIREGTTVCMEDVNQALSEMMANPKVQAIKHCSKMEQVFLQAVCAEVIRTGVEEVCLKNVYKQFESLCCFDGFRAPNITEALDICDRLGNSRLLICEDSSNDIYQRMLLNVSKDDIHYALQ
ncbi:PREDICTED: origin recognition complex subunit 1 [Dinoponera quadriceps]|uniref:Origin recognition complex subunit 1 n=1 Tax=Dinoponera quadriceps TaxID=609295 RepID=A0A6P3YC93_DINQU|nr:PREDICTED: origin recognition complex subunit 1 [Dinoponera quadriceps]XP_014487584.1 PREDICTED: origin recognition complex subunit 1 [Dinoponera quadriceps]